MRKPHYWRAAGEASAPSEIVVLDCETHFGPAAAADGGEWQRLRLGCAIAYRLEGGRRTRYREMSFTTPEQFWELVVSRLNDKRPVWVVGHNLPYDLGAVSGWGVITGPRYQTVKAAVSGQMFFLKGYLDNKPLNFVDTVNYYRCPLSAIGKAVGLPKMEFPKYEDSDAVWSRYCMNDVKVTAAGLDKLIEFIRAEKLGPWQPSIASLSFAAFRARFLQHKVLVHCDRRALALERAAYYGGIVDVAFVGRVPASPVWELDVVSMFPFCACGDLPYHKKYVSDRIGPRRLRTLMESYSVIAEVELDTPEPYPVRLRAGTYYPTGRFVTTLAHPELEYALTAGHVRYVRRAAWYLRAPVMREYMEYFVARKQEYREREDGKAFETLCKYYANSLYGKTGQLAHSWREWGSESLRKVEQDYGLTDGTLSNEYDKPPDFEEHQSNHRFPQIDRPFDVRNLYGICEIAVGESESRDSCPAVAATITSAARVLLRSFQRAAGPGHWYYSDTDSIWVDGEGKERLEEAGCIAPGILGKLDVKGSHGRMEVFGPKDYRTPSVTRTKGLKATAIPDGRGGWMQLAFPGPSEQIKEGREGGVFVKHSHKTLHRRIKRCVVLPGGHTRPLVFPGENPEAAPGRNRRR